MTDAERSDRRSSSTAPRNATASIFLIDESINRVSEARRIAGTMIASSADEASKVLRGTHPDVLELLPVEGKERIGIRQVRDVIRSAQFAPSQAPYKVCTIPAAEALTTEAANALLKILEEPPRDLRFVLLAAHPSDLLPTIVSRSRLVRSAASARAEATGQLVQAGYDSSDARWLAALPLHEGELDRFVATPQDLATAVDGATQVLEAAGMAEVVVACLGEQPLLRRQGLLALLDRVAARDPDLLTEGVRMLASQERDALVRFLRDLLVVSVDLVRCAIRVPQRRDDLADRVRESFGLARLQRFCVGVDRAHQSLSVYGPTEAILLSLFLGTGEESG